jgi:UDP-N-acetylmuramate dehydrogenase
MKPSRLSPTARKQLLALVAYYGGDLRFAEPLSRHTSLRIGGEADALVMPTTPESLQAIACFASQANISYRILGKGSNLLVADEGVEGIVLKTAPALYNLEITDVRVSVGAGVPLPLISQRAMKQGLTGLEFGVGVPGSIGGALIMNAGTPQGTMGQVVERVEIMQRDGTVYWMSRKEMRFAYRDSALKGRQEIILGAQLRLAEGEQDEIAGTMRRLRCHRRQTQPLEWPSAGSIFKRPQGDYPGRLIELAGCKGLRVGAAEVSQKHANFIINRGRAMARDVVSLIGEIRERVYKTCGVILEPEVIGWGVEL